MNTLPIALAIFLWTRAECPPPVLVGKFDDKLGSATVTRAIGVCRVRYHGCLVKLERRSATAFWATCKRDPQ